MDSFDVWGHDIHLIALRVDFDNNIKQFRRWRFPSSESLCNIISTWLCAKLIQLFLYHFWCHHLTYYPFAVKKKHASLRMVIILVLHFRRSCPRGVEEYNNRPLPIGQMYCNTIINLNEICKIKGLSYKNGSFDEVLWINCFYQIYWCNCQHHYLTSSCPPIYY